MIEVLCPAGSNDRGVISAGSNDRGVISGRK